MLVVVFGPDHGQIGLELGLVRDTAHSFFARFEGPSKLGRTPFDVHCFGRLENGLADLGRCLFVVVFGPFCMAHSLVMAGEICPVRQGGNSERAEFTPLLLVSNLTYSKWQTVPEKVLTIAGANLSTRGPIRI